MPTRLPLLLLALLLFDCVGCSSARTETFDINVTNATDRPVTISLAKRGPPYEAAWASPEDIAIETPRYRERGGMGVIPPGKTASVAKLTGRFEPNTEGYLRVYAGDLTLSEMLSKNRGSPGRVDVQLAPGRNDIRVVDNGGHIAAQIDQPAGGQR
jgi:hypothetical protein